MVPCLLYCIEEVEIVVPVDPQESPTLDTKWALKEQVIGILLCGWLTEYTAIVISIKLVVFIRRRFLELSLSLNISQMNILIFLGTFIFQIQLNGCGGVMAWKLSE